MKFKRVEIQAFKSYLEGTFDFTINGEPADIVSIYAPNGFGKTSFYDAIDFCMTGNITRFVRDTRIKNLNKNESKDINKHSTQSFLRSNEAPAELTTTVKIITTENKPFERSMKKPRKGDRDHKFEDIQENKYFCNLILAQESIDAFLRETKPEDRYEKFMSSQMGNKKNDYEYQRKIIQLMLKELDNRRNKLNKEIEKIEKSNKKIVIDKDVFSKANQILAELQLLGYSFSSIDELFSEEKKEILDSKIVQIEHKIEESKNNNIKAKETILSHCNNFAIYQQKHENINLLQQQIVEIKKSIAELDIYKKVSHNRSTKQKQFDVTQQEINKLIEWHNKLPEYKTSIDIIEDFKVQITQKNIELEPIKIDVSGKKSNNNNLQQQKEQLVKKLKDYQDLKVNTPKYYENIEQLKKSLEIDVNSTKEDEEKILEINSYLIIKDNALKELKKLNLNNLTEILSNPDTEKEIIDVLKNISIEQQRLIKISQLKLITTKKLDDVKQQNDLIEKLIRLGTDIISKTQETKCPLCQYDYKIYETLSSQIIANPSLTNTQQKLISENQEYQVQTSKVQKTIQTLKQDFNNIKNDKINTTNSQIVAKKIELSQCNEKLANLRLKINGDTQELTKLQELTLKKTQIELESYIDTQNKEITSKLERLGIIIKSLLNEIKNSENKYLVIESEFKTIEGKLEQAQNNSIYLSFQEYLSQLQIPSQTPHPELVYIFKQRQQSENKKLIEIKNQLDENKGQLDELIKNRLPDFFNNSSEELTINLNTLNEKIAVIQKEIVDFTKEVNNLKLENELNSQNWQQLKFSFEQEVVRLEKLLESNRKTILNFDLLTQLADKALAYINQIKSTKKIAQLKKEIISISKLEEPLKADRVKVTGYLKEKIDEYFHTELINKIYSKIDPHPDFKKVKFECQMSESGNPKLLVYIEDSSGKKIVSPTLHFSSAQINVLSLSIFLAKALRTTDYEGNPVDCIFIDDPIQSMDAINVLGVIDLLRNLAVNLGKQIIISTHDENFHELLKRKIPPKLFKSKYLELESFGKVAAHEGQ